MKKSGFVSGLLFSVLAIFAAADALSINVQRIEPSHWWVGMKNPKLQLLLHGKNLSSCQVTIPSGETDWKLTRTQSTTNPDYLFLFFEISDKARPGLKKIQLERGKEKDVLSFELKSRSTMAKGAAGYTAEDVLYLIMPDRFSNGNTENDSPPGFMEKASRINPSGRHGGDLQGIENHLDYLNNLGISTLWLNPILENNQPEFSYHGYAITDYYKVDGRFGNLEDYKRLIRKCHQGGLKMVQDMVANHIGNQHYWMKSLPDTGWVHYAGMPYTRCNFRIETIADPNAAAADRMLMTDGWFDTHMADLNQRHPLLAQYLIQNTIWWIAESGIDGIRMDTWPYNDKDFMTRWCDEVKAEFPDFSIVGEIWVEQAPFAAYFTKGAVNQDNYKPSLPSCTDFPFYFGLTKGLNEKGSWESGLIRLYNALSQDFLYKTPGNNLIFASNHDLSRFITTQNGNYRKYLQGIGILLTMRGIPQLYYGDEFALEGDGSAHSNVRLDFKGGWAGDAESDFKTENLKGRSDSAFRFIQNLLRWRKTSKAVGKGNFVHYLPEDNVYVYFRRFENEVVMVAVNGNNQSKNLSLDRFRKDLPNHAGVRDVLENRTEDFNKKELEIPANGIRIFDIR